MDAEAERDSIDRAESFFADAVAANPDVARAVNRLADACGGVENWALVKALLSAWDQYTLDDKLQFIHEAGVVDMDALEWHALFGVAESAEPADVDPAPTNTAAPVHVGTRIIDLRDGKAQCTAVVTEVRDECVFARFDPPTRGPQSFAVSYGEFGVVPENPQDREGGDHG